jgi:hypothetical protein
MTPCSCQQLLLNLCSRMYKSNCIFFYIFSSLLSRRISLFLYVILYAYSVINCNFLIGIVGGGVQFGPLVPAATSDLLCQPWVIMMIEKLVE